MTTVNTEDRRIVEGRETVKDLFRGNPDFKRKMGVEEEVLWLKEGTLDQMDDSQNIAMFNAVRFDMSQEPCAAQIEHVSRPQSFERMMKILKQMHHQRDRLHDVGEQLGVFRSPFSTMAHVTGPEAMNNLIQATEDNPMRGHRQRLLMSVFGAAVDGNPYYPVMNTALHFTVGVKDMNEDLEMGRRAQFLMPFLFLLMENRPDHTAERQRMGLKYTFNQSMHSRIMMERGGIDALYFQANSGEELAELKYNDILDTGLMMYYTDKPNEKGIPETTAKIIDKRERDLMVFRNAMGSTLATRRNYTMARTQQWRWLKTKNLYDKKTGDATDLLQERRDFDPGIHQLQTMTLILAAIDFQPDIAGQVDALLSKFGLDAAQHDDNGFDLLTRSMWSAYYRGNTSYHGTDEYFNIQYGNGKMKDFAKEFMQIMDDFYRDWDARHGTKYSAMLEPARYIAETGRSDAKVANTLIHDDKSLMEYTRNHDPAWFLQPDKCVGMYEEDGGFGKLGRKRGKTSHKRAAANDKSIVILDERRMGEP